MANQQPKLKTAPKQIRPQVKPPSRQQMRPSYEVMMTAIPNGRQGDWLKFSLVLSPRLLGKFPKSARLGMFSQFKPLFTADWPNFIRSLTFDVFFSPPPGQPPWRAPAQGEWEFSPPPNNVPPFDAALWARIFHEATPVTGYQFDAQEFTNEQRFHILTFQEKAMYTAIKNGLYKSTAHDSSDSLPTKETILERLKTIGIIRPDPEAPGGARPITGPDTIRDLNRLRGIFRRPGDGKVPRLNIPGPKGGKSGRPGPGVPPIKQRGVARPAPNRRLLFPKLSDAELKRQKIPPQQLNYLKAYAFQHKFSRFADKLVTERPTPPPYDFHRILGSLFEYPALARRLGLCVDLRVRLDPKRPIPQEGTFYVRPVLKNPQVSHQFISPQTSYLLGGVTGFMSRPSPPPGSQSSKEEDISSLPLQDGLLEFGAKMQDGTQVRVFDVIPGNVDEVIKRVEVYSTQMLKKLDVVVKTQLSRPAFRNSNFLRSRGVKSDTESRLRFVTKSLNQKLLNALTSLPAGRSGGLSVAHNTRDDYLDELLTASSKNETLMDPKARQPGTAITFHAEHLVRGFRIDVREVRFGLDGTLSLTSWRSLSFRHGAYHLLGPDGAPLPNPILTEEDEGWISLGLTQEDDPTVNIKTPLGTGVIKKLQANPGSGKRLDLYQSLFRWDGWSLCVPRPGGCLGINDQPSLGQAERDKKNGPPMQVVLTPVPGTLPRLRFGRHYQFRARVVDLAGNSLAITDMPDLDTRFVTDPRDEDSHYLRIEPVPSPPVLLTAPLHAKQISDKWPNGAPLSPGESVDRMVFRSMNVEQPGTPQEGLPAGPPSRPASRHFVPPKISPELAEQHGMFDDPNTRLVRGAAAYNVMTAKDGNLSDLIPPERRAVKGRPGDEFYPEPSLLVPYLPDPMAEGVSFVIYTPGTDPRKAKTLQVPFPSSGGWPHTRSFRIQLEPGQGPPQLGAPDLLRVFVPPGEERIVRCSCYLVSQRHPQFGKPNKETQFAIWQWIEDRAKPQNREAVRFLAQRRFLAQSGRLWMLTPFHEVILVHATQQPVLTPQWVCIEEFPEDSFNKGNVPSCTNNTPLAMLSRHRKLGDTAATIDGTLAIHRASTEELDIQAEWREPIDHVNKPMTSENLDEWLYVQGSAAPFEVNVRYVPSPVKGPVIGRGLPSEDEETEDDMELELDEDFLAPRDAQELPLLSEVQSRGILDESTDDQTDIDTNFDVVQERGVPRLGRPQQKRPNTKSPVRAQAAAPKPQGPPPFDERPYRCAPAPPPPPPANYGQRFRFQGLHRFGDTKYRCVAYRAIGTSRYREYFFPMPNEENELLKEGKLPPRWTRTSPLIMLDILSTAQPEEPKVLYIIPTFKWEATPQGHRRVGGGLRVYLDRPWFSSGDGEQLAVVLFPSPTSEAPEYAKTRVTQWGLDPLWEDDPNASSSSMRSKMFKGQFNQAEAIRPRSIQEEEATSRGVQRGQQGLQHRQKSQRFNRYDVGSFHPIPANFRNTAAVRHDLVVKEVRLSVDNKNPFDNRTRPMGVTICAFDVKPDIARQLWYCDIEMDPGTAYFPFVRLALARYQVNSIRGAHLSPVVQADFAQLVPNRTASVVVNQKNPNQVIVTVAGVGGIAAPSRTTKVEIEIEEFNPNIPDELGWAPLPNAKPVPLPRVNPQQWTGPIRLPPPDGKQHRLVIKEYEVFQIENEADSTAGPREDRRLVYADVLPITR